MKTQKQDGATFVNVIGEYLKVLLHDFLSDHQLCNCTNYSPQAQWILLNNPLDFRIKFRRFDGFAFLKSSKQSNLVSRKGSQLKSLGKENLSLNRCICWRWLKSNVYFFFYFPERIIVKLRDGDVTKWIHISMNYLKWCLHVTRILKNQINLPFYAWLLTT